MKHWLKVPLLTLVSLALPLYASDRCVIENLGKAPDRAESLLDQDNWLAPENLRIGLQSANQFMPLLKISSPAAPAVLRTAPQQLDLERIKAVDRLDQQPRDLGFLLDRRLYADALLVVRNGKVLSEKYWNGVAAQQPRLLLEGTRPVLSLLGAMAVAQGKLSQDKSIIRYVPALSAQGGLRKLSIQRLLEGSGRFDWSAREIADWQAAGGWTPGNAGGGVRAWLAQPQRWDKDFSDVPISPLDAGPDGELLAWVLAEIYREPVAQVFCDELLGKLRPENPVFWLTDPLGNELSGGLAFSLRDFARFGQMLVEARNSGSRSKIPGWFIETLMASGGAKKINLPALAGLKKGSEVRYGFVHLGGAANRVAILGPYGNSLYIDFDQRLVIAIFAAYPKPRSAGMLATLEAVWDALDLATQPAGKH